VFLFIYSYLVIKINFEICNILLIAFIIYLISFLHPRVEHTSYPVDKIRTSQNAVRDAMPLRCMSNWSLILMHSQPQYQKRWVANPTVRPLYSRGRNAQYPLDRLQGGPQRSPERGEKKKSSKPACGNCEARSQIRLISLSGLLCYQNSSKHSVYVTNAIFLQNLGVVREIKHSYRPPHYAFLLMTLCKVRLNTIVIFSTISYQRLISTSWGCKNVWQEWHCACSTGPRRVRGKVGYVFLYILST
jgi:hypothetical protein